MKHLQALLLLAVSASFALVPLSPAPAAVRMSAPVPVTLRGVWAARIGPIKEPCSPASDDFKWSFTADAAQLRYWEARGIPTKVRHIGPNRFVIDLAMTGEGSNWSERRTFSLSADGRTLVVDKPVPDLKLRESRYVRCPAIAAATFGGTSTKE